MEKKLQYQQQKLEEQQQQQLWQQNNQQNDQLSSPTKSVDFCNYYDDGISMSWSSLPSLEDAKSVDTSFTYVLADYANNVNFYYPGYCICCHCDEREENQRNENLENEMMR